jgi:hypothetical protein
MKNVNIKLSLPKSVNIRIITTLILMAVILFEIYLVYFNMYARLIPQPNLVITQADIVRIDRDAFKEVNDYLHDADTYTPTTPISINPNPFKFNE